MIFITYRLTFRYNNKKYKYFFKFFDEVVSFRQILHNEFGHNINVYINEIPTYLKANDVFEIFKSSLIFDVKD